MRRTIILFLFLLFYFTVLAQSRSSFQIQRFNTENGLPSNGIKGLQWDDQTGFLWIATEAGIVRYNGMDFKIYGKEDDPHITNARILFLIKNNAGRIYTADNIGNLFFIEKNNLRFLENRPIETDSGNNFISIAVSDKLYKTKIDFKKQVYTLQFDKILPLGDTTAFVVHPDSLVYYSRSTPLLVTVLNDKKIHDGFKCDNNFFVIDQKNDVLLFDRKTRRCVKTKISVDGHEIQEDLKQAIFIWENGMKNPILFTKEKAWLLSYRDGELQATLVCNNVPQDVFIRFAQFDEKSHTLFIGTDSKGVLIIKKNRVESLRMEGTKPTERTSYYSQFELPDGNVMTNEGHILGQNVHVQQTLPLKGKFSPNILQVGDSILWYSQTDPKLNYACLHSYNFNTGITKTFPKIHEDYQLVLTVADNKIYVAKENGISVMDDDSLKLLYAYPRGKSGIDYDMQEISPGVLAIANCNSLLRLDIKSHKLDTIYTTSSYCIRTIWQYNGYIFFGSYGGGLFIYKNGIVKPLPLDKNNYLLFTHCFVKDEAGYCWISTNRGLFKASIEELISAFNKNLPDVYYYYYGKNDGMEMTELNGGCIPCALVKKNKTISFPTMDGLLWVDPQQAQSLTPSGEIYVDNILVDNKFIAPDSLASRELPAKTAEIILRLGISAWTNKENIYLWYRINDESAWLPINIEKGIEIGFNNLPQGKYVIHIKKRNGFGKDNYSFKDVEFNITIPWYKRVWFYLSIVAVIYGLVMLYINLRTRQLRANQLRLEKLVAEKTKELQLKNEVLEKNDSIKTRLISIISHDIVTPLKFLTAAGKNLIEKRRHMTEDLQDETIKEMANTSQDLQMLSTNILNWIKYQNENRRLTREEFNLHDMVNHVISVLNSLARQKEDKLVNNVAENFVIYEYFEPLRIIIYNLVSNAINFTERGKIIVNSKIEDDSIVISISDEGVGMTGDQIRNIAGDQFIISSVNVDNKKGNGLGYLIIKDLLKMMEGAFTIQSERGRGTTVSILISATKRR